jgi:hypothetical protein
MVSAVWAVSADVHGEFPQFPQAPRQSVPRCSVFVLQNRWRLSPLSATDFSSVTDVMGCSKEEGIAGSGEHTIKQ